MAKGDVTSVRIAKDCLTNFGVASGLNVNTLKPSIYTAGIVGCQLKEIQTLLNIPQGTMPFRYLGIPLASQKLKVMHFALFIDKIATYINAWTSTSLSFAGMTELIQAVLQGIECFWLSIFPIPAAVADRISRLCRNFLWSSKHPLVPWKEVCLPKSGGKGGGGFWEICGWNLALLTKSFWNIHQKKDTLWVQWVHHVYLGSQSIWECLPKKEDSPLLKRLLYIRDLVCQQEGSVETAIQRFSNWVHGSNISISNAYNYFRAKGTIKHWTTEVWNPCIIPKHAFILWLSAKSRLCTKDKLQFLDIDKACALCGLQEESQQHLFFTCNISSAIWRHIRVWLGITRSMTTIARTSWKSKAKRIALAYSVYQIWIARNQMIFEGLGPKTNNIICKIKIQVYKVMFTLYPLILIQFEDNARGTIVS
ncbi:hypothetical protein Pfo_007988 [Paulownia fortunei]|nr:hypothetical protein Pfo_007988 [Paulownia fortunei]